ncbi:uncharacterized protein [Typha angustifolia]|uniref:uncharacterized protein n=1 Tax=Typha angustifolia TaxID=59011 RepID=UPI003C2D2437
MDFEKRYGVTSPSSPSSLKQKLRNSICFSCCFNGGGASATSGDEEERPISLIRSSSTWIRARAQELPEIGDRCRGLVSRIGRHRRLSGDFGYDPLSYALNFDEGIEDDDAAAGPAEGFRYRNFSARLPASPPRPPTAAVAIA